MDENGIHKIFEFSILLKGAQASIELMSGIGLYLVSTATIKSWVGALTQEELIENPNDFIASYIFNLAQNFSVSSKTFYAFYLSSHGLIKILLVIGLLRGK